MSGVRWRRFRELDRLYVLAGLADGCCEYCLSKDALQFDHVPALAVLDAMCAGERALVRPVIVYACGRCNCMLGARPLNTVHARRVYVFARRLAVGDALPFASVAALEERRREIVRMRLRKSAAKDAARVRALSAHERLHWARWAALQANPVVRLNTGSRFGRCRAVVPDS